MARLGKWRDSYRVLFGIPEGKKPLGRPRRTLENNIKMDLQEVECGGIGWIVLALDKDRWWVVVKAVISLLLS